MKTAGVHIRRSTTGHLRPAIRQMAESDIQIVIQTVDKPVKKQKEYVDNQI
jgi:hypothetical protein